MKRVFVCVSGGRTSAYMAIMLKQNPDRLRELVGEDVSTHFVFMNTGQEHDDTLRFLDAVDREYGLGLVWLEAVVDPRFGAGTTHRVVSFETAFRADEWDHPDHPFHAFIRKYGVPNIAFRRCTNELKLNSNRSYQRTFPDYDAATCYEAIGIRADETRRVTTNARKGRKARMLYPLIDLFPSDLDDVLGFFEDKPWDLRIPKALGNCVTCYKKSWKTLLSVWKEVPKSFEFNREMEARHQWHTTPKAAPLERPRFFFRNHTSTEALLRQFQELEGGSAPFLAGNPSTCSESCEMYETEEMDV